MQARFWGKAINMRFMLLGLGFITIFGSFPAYAGDDSHLSVKMPVTVRLLDFETTKKICGSNAPPAWCPAHLLASEPQEDPIEALLAMQSRPEPFDRQEFEKRARIQKVKDRMGYKPDKM